MTGGEGNDTYVVDYGTDKTIEQSGANTGTDTVLAYLTWTLGNDVENLALMGLSALNGTGNALNNIMQGNGAANVLKGLTGTDSISGGGGNDTITGGAGSDVLAGGAGLDFFVFDTALGTTNIDIITDFSIVDDTLHLVGFAAFPGLPVGPLAASAFYAGTGTLTAAHRIIYNPATGALFFDKDGSGVVAPVQFATLIGLPVIDHTDIGVI